ncbi:MAG: hypothetical protein KJ749_02710 [Planctomycetes bacterium]|nr:hypothetical protein [Planctomycetota bacterium]
MTRRLASLSLCIGLILPASALAGDVVKDALSAVPSQAMVVVCVPSLKQLDADYQQVVENLGLKMMIPPQWHSLLAGIKQTLPMLSGVDEEGSLAIVIMPATNVMELQMKQAILLPTKDPKGIIEAMMGQAGEGGLWTVTMMGQPAHAAITKTGLVLAAFPDVVKAVKDAEESLHQKLNPVELKALQGLDVLVWGNAEVLAGLVKPMWEGMVLPVMMAAQSTGGAFDKVGMETNKRQVEMLLEGASSLGFGIALDKNGVGLRGLVTVKPGSELAKQVKLRTTEGSLLQGLPGGDYMLVAGELIDPEASKEGIKQLDPFFALADGIEEVDQAKVSRLKDIVREFIPLMTGMRVAIAGLPPGPEGLLGLTVIIDTADAKKLLDLKGQGIDLAKQLASDAAKSETADEELQQVIDAIVYNSEAEEIAGVKVGHFKFDLSKIEAVDEDDLEDINKVIGKDGVLARIAPADDKTVVVAFGGGKERMAKLLEQAKKKDAPLDDDAGIKRIAAHIPKERASVGYLAVDRVIAFIQDVQRALDEEVLPIQMPAINAPVAMSMTGGNGWMQGDVFLPTELLVAGKDAVMTMMGPMMAPPAAVPCQTDCR